MFKSIAKIFRSFFHLFYPRVCSGCGKGLMSGESFICLSCRNQLVPTEFADDAQNSFYNSMVSRVPVESAVSFYYFTKGGILQGLLHEIKYKGRRDLARYIGNQYGNFLTSKGFGKNIDYLVPVPLHDRKAYKRGFNQSELLAHGMGEVMGIPVLSGVIGRKEDTQTQTNLTRQDRWENVKSAFVIKDTSKIDNKHLLLIDDVVTTGATLEACSRALLASSDIKLSLATLAYASEL